MQVNDDRPERGGAELAALLPTIPADRLMIETDAPYLVSIDSQALQCTQCTHMQDSGAQVGARPQTLSLFGR
jgi:Tat protein secretion system quality control protein TatD with DNase activity